MLLNREGISNAAVMIQPTLTAFQFNSLPAPALLDVASIAADRILLLDAYFSVVIFHGMTIAQWRNMGYQNQPEHQVGLTFSVIQCYYFFCLICGSFNFNLPVLHDEILCFSLLTLNEEN